MSVLRGVLVFVGAMLLQWWWNTHLSFWGAAPQFLLAFTVLIAARRGAVPAMLAGFVWGLFADAQRAEVFGASALLYVLAAYAAGMLRKQIDLRAIGPMAIAVFLLSWAYFIGYGFLGSIFWKSFQWVGWIPALATPFLNCLAAGAGALAWELRDQA